MILNAHAKSSAESLSYRIRTPPKLVRSPRAFFFSRGQPKRVVGPVAVSLDRTFLLAVGGGCEVMQHMAPSLGLNSEVGGGDWP